MAGLINMYLSLLTQAKGLNQLHPHHHQPATALPQALQVNRDLSALSHQQQTALAHVQANLQRSVTHASKTAAHMVQNQMTPSYQYAQAGLEDYHHQVVSTASTVPPDGQFKDQPTFSPPTAAAVTANGGVEQQTVRRALQLHDQTDLDGEVQATTTTTVASPSSNSGPKRLHVSNIPFRFREADLRQLLAFGPILDVEIIFNERGSKGFGFVTFANSADADRAREKLNGTVVEGRKIEVNNATARVMTKKTPAPTIPNAAALRGVALTRGRAAAARGAYTAAAAAAAAAFRHPAPLATAATALPYTAGVYQDPFLAATAYPERYQVGNVLVTSQPYAAGYPATAARYAIPTVASAATYAAAAGYGRDYAADPYLGHSIGPVAGFGATVYGRAGYQRYAPY
ncbi:RNA binding protein fox-1 homolog 2-like isoform X4 [Liolophura sinensis]|uniref:RNA binding protein fox-1 homolog 2-like isoform X4 n=1 Tax=Liolophura sinensis TaxID=3198878 RepID=UPI0031583F86